VVTLESDDWCVAVFKCKSENGEKILAGFYEFVKDLQGVEDLHFIIRDRSRMQKVQSHTVQADYVSSLMKLTSIAAAMKNMA